MTLEAIMNADIGGTVSSDKPRLQSLQKVESSKGHGRRESRAMECIADEMGQRRGGSGRGRAWVVASWDSGRG